MSDFIRLPPAPEWSPPEWLKDFDYSTIPEIDSRTAASLVLPDLDYESQLAAIHHLLRGHKEADEILQKEITEIDEFAKRTSGIRNERAVEDYIARVHRSIYEDAARSMAAVGMLAPMLESVFYQAFQGIRKETHERLGLAPAIHARWSRPAEDQWDCHYVWKNGRRGGGLAEGVIQLADAVGLAAHMPPALKQTLEALFEYRNKMFHNGFEWPVEQRTKFAERIEASGWPEDWFGRATSDGKPWIFYMSDEFIKHTVKLIDEVIDGIGAYCKESFFPGTHPTEGHA